MGRIWTKKEVDDDTRKFFSKYKKKYLFIRIWKTATISIQAKTINIPHYSISYLENFINVDDYFKFTVVRNPYDRLVSFFFYKRKENLYEEYKDFKEWIMDGCPHPKGWQPKVRNIRPNPMYQYDWIINKNGEVKIDYILKFENLNNDWKILCNKININHKNLAHLNKSKHNSFEEYYDNEMIDLVSKKCYRELQAYNYDFNGPTDDSIFGNKNVMYNPLTDEFKLL